MYTPFAIMSSFKLERVYTLPIHSVGFLPSSVSQHFPEPCIYGVFRQYHPSIHPSIGWFLIYRRTRGIGFPSNDKAHVNVITGRGRNTFFFLFLSFRSLFGRSTHTYICVLNVTTYMRLYAHGLWCRRYETMCSCA